MSGNRSREEAANVQLAIVISELGVAADAETIHVHGKHRPDVLFSLRGLRVAIEGKFADHSGADAQVLEDARGRITAGIAHIAAAVVYPKALRTTPTAQLADALRGASLRWRIVSEGGETDQWASGAPADLMAALRRAQESLTGDDVVARAAQGLRIQLDAVANLWLGQEGASDRLSTLLLGSKPPTDEAPTLRKERRETAAKVAALVLANAFIFQEQLAAGDSRVETLTQLDKQPDLITGACKTWKWIYENVNYRPIFELGERALSELPHSKNTMLAVRNLLREARSICGQQAALRHDLMGRIYHWLLHHAKYLGTYYTSTSAATLLMGLTLNRQWATDFGDARQLANFKVADLACGTGTLLMASAQALSDAYIRERADSGRSLNPVDLRSLHEALMQNVLHGYDVLPSAVHLTASTLALLAPEVAFRHMNLWIMPMGLIAGNPRLGSLDFLASDAVRTQVSLDLSQSGQLDLTGETIRTGASSRTIGVARIPDLDLCVMNPPFVRSVGGNLLFGSLPEAERKVLQTELKKQAKPIGAEVTAGLGSVFVALADRHMKPGGRLAFILPLALASGEAWGPTRALIARRYHLETVIVSHDAERPNFSENTDLSEVMFIARRLAEGEAAGRTTYVNLWKNPTSIHEALDLASRIEAVEAPSRIEDAGFTTIQGEGRKLGEVFTTPAPEGEGNWTGALFAQTELARIWWKLSDQSIMVPASKAVSLVMTRLDGLGALGPDRKRVHEGFTFSKEDYSPYRGFWGHDAKTSTTISQNTNMGLVVWQGSPRGPTYGPHLWQRAGRIQLVERLWPITHKVLAVGLDEKALANTWWPLATFDLSDEQEKSLLVWLNSSVALIQYFGRRVITRSAWMQMKQPAWESMPVLDVRGLDPSQLESLVQAYDDLADQPLLPLARLNVDPVRKKIDAALSVALGLPDLKPLRDLLAREPGLTGVGIGAPAVQGGLDLSGGGAPARGDLI